MKKILKVLLAIVLSVIVLLAAVSFAVGPIAKRYIEKNSLSLLGREISVGKIALNIFAGKLTLKDIAVYEADGEEEFLSFGELSTRVRIAPLLHQRLIVPYITLSNADINIIQMRDKFNFDDITSRFAADSTEVEKPKEPSKWLVELREIGIRNTSILYADLSVGSRWELDDFSVIIPGISFSGGDTNVGLSLNFKQGGELLTRLQYDMQDEDYDLYLSLKGFDMSLLQPYLKQSMDLSSLSGLVSTELKINGNLNRIIDFNASGTASIEQLSLKDPSRKQVAAVSSVKAEISRINLAENCFDLKSLTIDNLAANYIVEHDGSTNINRLMRAEPKAQNEAAAEELSKAEARQAKKDSRKAEQAARKEAKRQQRRNKHSGNVEQNNTVIEQPTTESMAEAAASTKNASRPMKLSIGKVSLRNAAIDYVDNSLPDKFSYRINNINVLSNHFSLDGTNSVHADAVMNDTGKLTADWNGSLKSMSNQRIALALQNIALADFSPYSVRYTGYPVTSGAVAFNSINTVVNNALEGNNRLEIASPTVDKKRSGVKAEYNIPLRLGLYVITDKNNRAVIDLPVSGDVSSPEFSYKKLILTTLSNLFVKIVTAPTSFLADALGFKNAGATRIEFDPTANDLNVSEYAKLDNLAEMLNQKEGLKITFTPNVNYDAAAAILSAHGVKNTVNTVGSAQKRDSIARNVASGIKSGAINALRQAITDPKSVAQQLTDTIRSTKENLTPEHIAQQVVTDISARTEAMIRHSATSRDSVILAYLVKRLHVPADKITIDTLSMERMKAFKGKSAYTVDIAFDQQSSRKLNLDIEQVQSEIAETAAQTSQQSTNDAAGESNAANDMSIQ